MLRYNRGKARDRIVGSVTIPFSSLEPNVTVDKWWAVSPGVSKAAAGAQPSEESSGGEIKLRGSKKVIWMLLMVVVEVEVVCVCVCVCVCVSTIATQPRQR